MTDTNVEVIPKYHSMHILPHGKPERAQISQRGLVCRLVSIPNHRNDHNNISHCNIPTVRKYKCPPPLSPHRLLVPIYSRLEHHRGVS